MKTTIVTAALFGLLSAPVAGVAIGQDAPNPPKAPDAPKADKGPDAPKEVAPPADPNAAAFVEVLMKSVGNKNPRIRFAVREALVTMGHQSVAPLTRAHEATADKHVQAFIERTMKRVKQMAKRLKRSSNASTRFMSMLSQRAGRDIDRIAMDLNLTWDEMDKIAPIFAGYDKNRKELMAEMREGGGFSDPGAWKDLSEEMKAMGDDLEPELVALLGEKRGKRAKRYLRGGGLGSALPMMLGDVTEGSFDFDGGVGTVRIIRPGGGDNDK